MHILIKGAIQYGKHLFNIDILIVLNIEYKREFIENKSIFCMINTHLEDGT